MANVTYNKNNFNILIFFEKVLDNRLNMSYN